MELGDQARLSDAGKPRVINTWSLRHLTSAEEYPDEEYLDMSKSSSLKYKRQGQVCCYNVCLCQNRPDSRTSQNGRQVIMLQQK